MREIGRRLGPMRRLWAPLALVLLVAASSPLGAQVPAAPSSVNPTAASVQERALLEALKPGGPSAVSGRISIPDRRAANLIQPAGLEWRAFHQRTLPRIGAFAILGMLALLAVFYLVRGRIPIRGGAAGVTMARFGGLDRFAHWLTALSFLALALSGLNLTFGKSLLLPLIGPQAFASLSATGKLVHNTVGFAFMAGLVLMLVLWIKDNIPHPRDLVWLVKGGGLLGGHVEAARFNAGQKLIFWAVILGGGLLSVTGLVLMLQTADVAGLQWASMLHGIVAVVLVAVILAHIYIGSIGMEGAFQAMGSGKVDVNWAREHHALWVERMEAKEARRAASSPAE